MAEAFSPEEIQELAKAMRSGDREAFARLYDAFADPLYRFILRRTGRQADAEDLVATVFMKVWDKRHTYNPDKAHFKAWLYRIASNAVVDFYRRFKPEYQLDYTLEDGDLEKNPLHQTRQVMLREKIAHVLSKMKPDDASLITWRFFDGLSVEEIAERLSKKAGAVRVQQFRALKKFQQLCEKDGLKL